MGTAKFLYFMSRQMAKQGKLLPKGRAAYTTRNKQFPRVQKTLLGRYNGAAFGNPRHLTSVITIMLMFTLELFRVPPRI